MKTEIFGKFVAFLEKLEQQDIDYTLAHNRAEAMMVLIAVPGERWEIEFMGDGSVEVEKFVSTGEVLDAQSLDELFARYAASEQDAEFPSRASLSR